MSAARAAMSPREAAERSSRIREAVLALPELVTARSVFVYVSHGKEVGTHELIRVLLQRGKTVAAPLVIAPGLMEAHRIEGLDGLEPGKFGILAPGKRDPLTGCPDISLCPGVAFSPRGDRLGRGQGFYDRFLALHPDCIAVGLGFDFQVVEGVPVSPEDRRMAVIVTDRRTIRPGTEDRSGGPGRPNADSPAGSG